MQILNNREQNYPYALEKKYPRVFSQVMAFWDSPEIDLLFAELMVTKRSKRQGFPPDVASDLIYLSMVNSRMRSERKIADPWAHVSERHKDEIEKNGVPFTKQGFIKAAESHRTDLVGLFLSSGAHVDTYDERLWTPLMISSFNGDEDMATLLIKNGADVHHRDGAGYSPLHWAAFNGYSKVFKLLLSKGADANAPSNLGWTPLMQAASRGHLLISYLLIDNGANVNAITDDGWTPLHKATENGHYPEVKLLLSKGADKKNMYSNGKTALDIAIKNKDDQIIALLEVDR